MHWKWSINDEKHTCDVHAFAISRQTFFLTNIFVVKVDVFSSFVTISDKTFDVCVLQSVTLPAPLSPPCSVQWVSFSGHETVNIHS